MPLTATYARASRLFSPPCNRKPEFAHLRSHVKLQLGLGVENTNSSSTLLPPRQKSHCRHSYPRHIPGCIWDQNILRQKFDLSTGANEATDFPQLPNSYSNGGDTLGDMIAFMDSYPSKNWDLTPTLVPRLCSSLERQGSPQPRTWWYTKTSSMSWSTQLLVCRRWQRFLSFWGFGIGLLRRSVRRISFFFRLQHGQEK